MRRGTRRGEAARDVAGDDERGEFEDDQDHQASLGGNETDRRQEEEGDEGAAQAGYGPERDGPPAQVAQEVRLVLLIEMLLEAGDPPERQIPVSAALEHQLHVLWGRIVASVERAVVEMRDDLVAHTGAVHRFH